MTDQGVPPGSGRHDRTDEQSPDRVDDPSARTAATPGAMPPAPTAAQKSSATETLVYGILGLVPLWGGVFGPIGWWFGNRELREIDAGIRAPAGRRKAKVGRILGIVGTLVWGPILIVSLGMLALSDTSPTPPWFAENGVTFVYPDSWGEMDLDIPESDAPVWRYAVTPDRASGNFISFTYVPEPLATELFGPLEGRVALVIEDAAELGFGAVTVARRPIEVDIAGLRGVRTSLDGVTGERTGQPLGTEIVFLFGSDASYFLHVQYEQGTEEAMLVAFEAMLADFAVP